ncbi:response regulator transcription factor [Mucilaginibacter jinjuensis]|uniref:Response regulator transcription factor n=1 Tax=Mucilaginibacter jinjuensis TaxID=1176721 RepID=A0ABY7T1L7_9SPHI|nr:response regulator transcription factor [Mucilaginibacter jinjuensis]WCT10340.1 response regulator transcription factor [Mucilaginibacter jinjuensis]
MKILLIEDEPELLKSIGHYLSQNNFRCDQADNIRLAQAYLEINDYDCIVLDITFPLGSGFDVLKSFDSIGRHCGILIISAKDSLEDKLYGLELGADDYLTKPFHLPELAARLYAIQRRRFFGGNDILKLGELMVNIRDKYAKTQNGVIDLTRKEFDLLMYFISNKEKVVTKQSIVDHLWGEHASMTDNHDLIYVHIKNLRKKLVEKGCPDYISGVYGVGYRFSIDKSYQKI